MRRLMLGLILLTGALSVSAKPQPGASEAVGKLLRIGGQYRISSIEKRADADFRVRFTSEPKTGKHDELVLLSDHVHMNLQEGQVIRLSAEVIDDKGPILEVTQVLLFLPNEHGTTPIWLLSSQHKTQDFHGARWLEMHAPQSDYLIL